MLASDLNLDLTALIPVRNEVENMEPLLDELVPVLEGLGKTYEVILVDDGSTDGTYETLCQLRPRFPHVHLIKLAAAYGKTAALVAGWDRARGKIIVIMDGDLQHDPRDIANMIRQIPPYDLVCGYRTKRQDSWFRRLQSRIANWVRNRVIHDRIRDSGCAFRRCATRRCTRRSSTWGCTGFSPPFSCSKGTGSSRCRSAIGRVCTAGASSTCATESCGHSTT